MKVAANEAELEAIMRDSLQKTLTYNIAPKAKQIMQQHVIQDVYDAYSPELYQRRGAMASGGYIQAEVNGLTMLMTDQTPGNTPIYSGYTPSGTDLSKIINDGLQGNGYGAWTNAFARPYVENTQKDVNEMVIRELHQKYG